MNERKLKVAILAFWYPPLQAPGSLRARAFAEDAEANGVETLVITVATGARATPDGVGGYEPPPGVQVERIPGFELGTWLQKFRRRKPATAISTAALPQPQPRWKVALHNLAYWGYRNLICFPDPHLFWHWQARWRLVEILDREHPDILLVTAHPVTGFLMARFAQKQLPWLRWAADYRDLWSGHPWYKRPWPLSWYERWLERRTVGTACRIITTTQEFRDSLETLFPGRRIDVVYNGYSEKDGPRAQPTALEKFTVCHAGLLYAQRRPDLFFQALHNLAARGEIDSQRIAIEFYGKVPPEFSGWVKEHGLETMVKACGTLPRPEILERQRRSNLLLLIQTGDGALPSKLFEYMGTGIPILALVDAEREAAGILRRTGAGAVCATVADAETALLEAYRHWLATGCNQVLPANPETAIFNRREQSRRLYEILKLQN